MTTNQNLPDVAKEVVTENYAPIDWVGMGAIEVPVLLTVEDRLFHVPARADAKVSLDKKASRGIHMSRLYLITQNTLGVSPLSLSLLGQASDEFLQTHQELSTQSFIQVQFEMPLMRAALKSNNKAWRTYPVKLSVENNQGQKKYFVEVLVTYSSTCPASAALARQLIQDNFKQNFSDKTLDFDGIHTWLGTTQGIIATPHAQRSFARVKVEVTPNFSILSLIDAIEDSLGTAVQGAVKREDEQEFALRNGQNLMFCEDAARRVKEALDQQTDVVDYLAEFNHVESLHPHSAVSLISAGKSLRAFSS